MLNWNGQSTIAKIGHQENDIEYRDTVFKTLLGTKDRLSKNKCYREESQQLLKLRTARLEIARIRYLGGKMSLKDFLGLPSKRYTLEIDTVKNQFN